MKTKKTRVKIAVDARYLSLPGGGFHIYLLGLINSLRRSEQLEITYLVDHLPENFQLRSNESVAVLKKYHSNLIWEQISLAKHLLSVKYDIILFPYNFGVPLLFKKSRAKCVLILHDLIPIEIPHYIYRRWFYAIPFYIFVPVSVFKASLIITDSHYSAHSILRLFHHHSEVCYPPIDFSPIDSIATRESITEKYHIITERYFIYTGGYDPRKNVEKIIKAFELFSASNIGYSLVMTGIPRKKYLKIIDRTPKVISVGYVTEGDKNSLIKHACALINGSSMEGFGLPVVEAFRLGTPVITTVNSSLKEIVDEAGIHILNENVGSILDAMIEYSRLDDNGLYQQAALGYKQLKRLDKTDASSRIVQLILE